jgi:hypothetical protein
VLELLSGGDLLDRIEAHGPLDERAARRLTAQLLRALQLLHGRGLVHGHLAPSHVLFESSAHDSSARLVDLSRARRLTPPAGADGGGAAGGGAAGVGGSESQLRGLCGTPDYAAPEVLSWLGASEAAAPGAGGARGYGTAVDLWSLGVVVYIALSGFPPFSAEDEPAMLARIAAADFEFPESLAAGSGAAGGEALPTAWARVSPLAKDFVRRLIVAKPAERLDAAGALRHRWVSERVDSAAISLSLGQLRTRADAKWDARWGAPQSARPTPTPQAAEAARAPSPPRAAGSADGSASARPTLSERRQLTVDERAALIERTATHAAATQAYGGGSGSTRRSAATGGGGSARMRWSLSQGPSLTSKFSRWLLARAARGRQLRLLVLGLDGAGKTSMLRRLRHGRLEPVTAPTVGARASGGDGARARPPRRPSADGVSPSSHAQRLPASDHRPPSRLLLPRRPGARAVCVWRLHARRVRPERPRPGARALAGALW